MRTRNFRAQNEIVERGAVAKSQKGKKASAERKVGESYKWEVSGQCSKGDSCSFRQDPASGQDANMATHVDSDMLRLMCSTA